MPRTTAAEVQAVYQLADEGMDLWEAYLESGQPGTWGNVQRQYKALPVAGPGSHSRPDRLGFLVARAH